MCVRVFGALTECFIPPKEGVLKKKEEKNFKAQNAANCFALNDSVVAVLCECKCSIIVNYLDVSSVRYVKIHGCSSLPVSLHYFNVSEKISRQISANARFEMECMNFEVLYVHAFVPHRMHIV